MNKDKKVLFMEMGKYHEKKNELSSLLARRTKLENSLHLQPNDWRIEVDDTIYPGVTIHIGEQKLEKDKGLDKVIVFDKRDQIHFCKISFKKWS